MKQEQDPETTHHSGATIDRGTLPNQGRLPEQVQRNQREKRGGPISVGPDLGPMPVAAEAARPSGATLDHTGRSASGAARGVATLAGLGLLLSSVLPWSLNLWPNNLSMNELIGGLDPTKSGIAMTVPLVVSGLLVLIGALVPALARSAMGPVLMWIGAALAVITVLLWWSNHNYGITYGTWVGVAATVLAVVGAAMATMRGRVRATASAH